jgi:hypothetical protein
VERAANHSSWSLHRKASFSPFASVGTQVHRDLSSLLVPLRHLLTLTSVTLYPAASLYLVSSSVYFRALNLANVHKRSKGRICYMKCLCMTCYLFYRDLQNGSHQGLYLCKRQASSVKCRCSCRCRFLVQVD